MIDEGGHQGAHQVAGVGYLVIPEIAKRLSGRRVGAALGPDPAPGSPLTQRPGD